MLPADGSGDGKRRWPVLYLLHGCCDTYDAGHARRHRAAGARDVLVVMPDGGDVGFYSDWRDGPGWETFHPRELPRTLLERDYGAVPKRDRGLSMGGGGAMAYAGAPARMFRAAASFSGLVHPLADAGWLERPLLGATRPTRARSGATRTPTAMCGPPRPDRAAADAAGTRLFVSAGYGARAV